MPIKERVERVKEFLLRPLLASQKLNVVNQEKVGLSITLPELDQIAVLDRVDELIDEQLTRDINHLHVFSLRPDILADRLHQMRLAKADATINEQWIVRARWRLRDGKTGRVRDFVIRADDERFECVPRIEPGNCCAWSRIHLRGQRFLYCGRFINGTLRPSCRRSAKLYRARPPKSGDDRILQSGHVITLDPKLVDVVRNSKRNRFILRLD